MSSTFKKKKIKGLIFDTGGVLVENFGDAFLKNASRVLGVSARQIKKAVAEDEGKRQRGEETSLQFWHKVCKKLGVNCPSNKILLSLWVNPYIKKAKVKKDTLALVRRLRRNYRLAVLSNTIEEHGKINKKRGVFNNFDAVLLSCEAGMRKPERRFFALASKKLGIPFKNLIFIDDEIRWVKAARRYGLRAILFKNARQLKNKLYQLENSL